MEATGRGDDVKVDDFFLFFASASSTALLTTVGFLVRLSSSGVSGERSVVFADGADLPPAFVDGAAGHTIVFVLRCFLDAGGGLFVDSGGVAPAGVVSGAAEVVNGTSGGCGDDIGRREQEAPRAGVQRRNLLLRMVGGCSKVREGERFLNLSLNFSRS